VRKAIVLRAGVVACLLFSYVLLLHELKRTAASPVPTVITVGEKLRAKVRRKQVVPEIIAEDTVRRYSRTPQRALDLKEQSLNTVSSPSTPAVLPQLESTGPQNFIWYNQSYSIFLTPQEATLTVTRPNRYGSRKTWLFDKQGQRGKSSHSEPLTVQMRFLGSNPLPTIDARRNQRALSSATQPQGFSEVRFRGVYPGVDVLYQSDSQQLRYAFVLAGGVEPHTIRLAFVGATSIRIVHGALLVSLPYGDIRWQAPLVYREQRNGSRTKISAEYVLTGSNQVAVSWPLSTAIAEKRSNGRTEACH